MSGIGTSGRLGTAFVDRSGTCSGTPGTFTPALAANPGRGYARITNNNASAKIYVYDKALGAPTVANSVPLAAGASFVWDIKIPNNAIQVASDTAGATYEGAEG